MQLDLTCFQYSDVILKEPDGGVQGGGVFIPITARFFLVAFLCSLAPVKYTWMRIKESNSCVVGKTGCCLRRY